MWTHFSCNFLLHEISLVADWVFESHLMQLHSASFPSYARNALISWRIGSARLGHALSFYFVIIVGLWYSRWELDLFVTLSAAVIDLVPRRCYVWGTSGICSRCPINEIRDMARKLKTKLEKSSQQIQQVERKLKASQQNPRCLWVKVKTVVKYLKRKNYTSFYCGKTLIPLPQTYVIIFCIIFMWILCSYICYLNYIIIKQVIPTWTT